MALVAVTRFDDHYEGLIAASALNAAGIAAVCHVDGLSGITFILRQASFGSGLWVEASDVVAAREFLAERKGFDPSALGWTQHRDLWRGAPLAILAVIDAGFTGWLIAGAKARPTPMRWGTVALVLFLYVSIVLSFVEGMFSIGLPF